LRAVFQAGKPKQVYQQYPAKVHHSIITTAEKSMSNRDVQNTPTPHDLAFKQFLHHPETARDFMQIHLPAHLKNICDLSTLKLESGSFVEDRLRPYFSDILYSLKTTTGGEGYACILIEHQSTPDKNMAFRLLRYSVAAMQRHLDAGHSRLPLVIPILFYTGKRSPYPYSTRWLDSFDDPLLAENLYNNAFPLIDVTIIPDHEIMNHRSMAALTLLQKHIRQRDLNDLLDNLVILLHTWSLPRQQLVSLINYFSQAGQVKNAENFVRKLAQRIPQYKETLMTIAEQLEQKGRNEGVKQGKFEVARTMLQKGLDDKMIMEMTGLNDKELAQCRH